ncbi:hypothetical protein HGM15179_012863 [Zosterops borbonicus]|uniref:Uncharacterized protein n=1 Tax=Zosterops borbonicus TaxID=364589 RepID=A0A8K1LHW3_9PASS|nr:hypothetical protein HGM15179_012863 [Zosterops borbonicus]
MLPVRAGQATPGNVAQGARRFFAEIKESKQIRLEKNTRWQICVGSDTVWEIARSPIELAEQTKKWHLLGIHMYSQDYTGQVQTEKHWNFDKGLSYLLNAFPIICHSSVKGFLLTIFSKKVNHPEEAAHMPSQHPTIRINGNVLQSNGHGAKLEVAKVAMKGKPFPLQPGLFLSELHRKEHNPMGFHRVWSPSSVHNRL